MFEIPSEFNCAFLLLSVAAFCLAYYIGKTVGFVLFGTLKVGFSVAEIAGAFFCVLGCVAWWLLFSTSLWYAIGLGTWCWFRLALHDFSTDYVCW